jgi:hypothetical protein
LFKSTGTFVQSRQRGRARACFAWTWAGSGWFQPITVHHFPFFSARLKKFVGNSRKMIKIWDQFY